MDCKVRMAAHYRKTVPRYTDTEVRNHIDDVFGKRTPDKGNYNTPEWKVYRNLLRREARRRGITDERM